MENNKHVSKSTISKIRRYSPQVIAIAIKNVLLLIYGQSLGMPTIIIPSFERDDADIVLDENGISWLGSLNYLSVPVGCLFSGIITKPFGRIRSMQAICICFLVSFLLYYFATRPWHIFLALFLTGFSGGLLEAPTLVYTVEISEISIRGAACSTSSLFIVMGLLLSFIVGSLYSWRTMAMVHSGFSLIGLLLMFFIPESPHWLISHGYSDKARENLAWLRGWTKIENVDEEFMYIKKDALKENKIGATKCISFQPLKQYMKGTFIRPFLLICFTFILCHAGTTQINVYAVKIFEAVRAPVDSYVATISIGSVELLSSILLMLLVRFLGKRNMMFITQTGIFVSFLILGIYTNEINVINFESLDSVDELKAELYNWVPLVAVNSVVFFSFLMTNTLPWILMGELYPQDIKDPAAGLSAGAGYVIGFIANKNFLNLVNTLTLAGTFWLYSVIAINGLIIVYFWLPETEGKTLSEITDHFEGKRSLSNNVMRKSVREYSDQDFHNPAYETDGVTEL